MNMWKEVLSEGISFLTLGTVGAGIWHLSATLSKINEKIANIEKDVENIEKKTIKYDRLIKEVARMQGRLDVHLKKDSPLRVTDEGEAFLDKSGAKGHIEKHKEILLKEFDDISEPFEIQEKAVEVMEDRLRENNEITTFVYENGEDIKHLAKVAGIALRDIVLKHKGIA